MHENQQKSSEDPVLTVNGVRIQVAGGTVVAAAIAQAGIVQTRRSVSGAVRGPLCGMGVCFECRATVDGVENLRTCNMLCRDGMTVRTDE
jgi:D-hydroxyproline dehydrogenase subunit gamma